MIKMIDWP